MRKESQPATLSDPFATKTLPVRPAGSITAELTSITGLFDASAAWQQSSPRADRRLAARRSRPRLRPSAIRRAGHEGSLGAVGLTFPSLEDIVGATGAMAVQDDVV